MSRFDWRGFLSRMINGWVIAGALVVSTSLFCVTLAVIWATRPAPAAPGPATAVLNVITVPTITPTPVIPTATPVTPTPTVPAGSGGNFAVGGFVQITGTGGSGLRLRSNPGLQGEVQFLALEAEIFRVDEGPRDADGYTWWYLVAPYDANVHGWAAANYLQSVPTP